VLANVLLVSRDVATWLYLVSFSIIRVISAALLDPIRVAKASA